jgi:hypothetical protein
MPILAWISSLFSPAVSILENLHTSDADKMRLQNELAQIQANVNEKVMALEMEKIKLQEVEANSTNWLTSSWRPLLSLAIGVIIIAASFHLIPDPTARFWDLAQYFLVGYAGGRSIESATGNVVTAIGKIVKK